MTDPRRTLPSVSALLESAPVRAMLGSTPRSVLVAAARHVVNRAREDAGATPSDEAQWANAIAERIALAQRPSLRSVINATGVVLHTNLGRAPLAAAALD